MLIDTHAHLFWPSLWPKRQAILDRAKQAQVSRVIVPGIDLKTSTMAIELAKEFPELVRAAVGIHPEEIVKPEKVKLEQEKLEELIKQNPKQVVAIGEVGLDLFQPEIKNQQEKQKQLLKKMIELANQYQLPMIIHTRESVTETLNWLSQHPVIKRGVLHCFSGNESELKLALKMGWKVSFCGNISWSKRVAKLVKLVPDENLLLETDSPFMVPRNKEGQKIELRNEPKNVRILAEYYAQLRQTTIEQIALITSKNAQGLFQI